MGEIRIAIDDKKMTIGERREGRYFQLTSLLCLPAERASIWQRSAAQRSGETAAFSVPSRRQSRE
jgi:hypothetical protein